MKRPYTLAADDRADRSILVVLGHLFAVQTSTVRAVIVGTDIEALHDFRVANRRTRTVLSQLAKTLPPAVVATYSREFKWLGDATGPCRDLDVMLAEMVGSRPALGIDDDLLAQLTNFFNERRRLEHGRVCAALRSSRFDRLVEAWEDFLATEPIKDDHTPPATTSIGEVAGSRILRAFRRMRKRGGGIAGDPPAELLHRLRIDGKKLRYLIEFFSDFYPRKTVASCIGELKGLQDILGGFNDTVVQLALLRDYQEGHSPTTDDNATTRLIESIDGRQRDLRAEFSERFADFASEDSRKLYRKTFKPR